MEKEFVTYEQALALKELGFDEPCFTHYLKKILLNNLVTVDTINSKFDNSRCSAPLYQQAFRFFREKYNLSGLPTSAGIFQLRNTKHLIIKIIIT